MLVIVACKIIVPVFQKQAIRADSRLFRLVLASEFINIKVVVVKRNLPLRINRFTANFYIVKIIAVIIFLLIVEIRYVFGVISEILSAFIREFFNQFFCVRFAYVAVGQDRIN